MKSFPRSLLPAAMAIGLFASHARHAHAQADTQDMVYEFGDDDLLGEAFGSNDQLLRVRPGPVRTLLLRPRTQFVRELLRSVENL